MTSFPFLRLPELVQLEVIRNCEFPDIFRFSDCSRRVDTIISNANIALLGLEVDIYEDEVYFEFGFPKTDSKFMLKVRSVLGMGNNLSLMSETPAVGDRLWCMDIRAMVHVYPLAAAYVLRWLLNLFKRTELNKLHLEPSLLVKHLTSIIIKPVFPTVTKLYLEHTMNEDARAEEEQLVWTLDNIKVTKKIKIDCFINAPTNSYRRGFEAELVKISFPIWLHSDAIINSTTKTFKLAGQHPTSGFMNAILKAWMSNEKMANLELIYWTTDWDCRSLRENESDEHFQDHLMDGIEEAILTPEERDAESLMNEVDFCFERFVRRVDGKLAVFFMDRDTVRFRVC